MYATRGCEDRASPPSACSVKAGVTPADPDLHEDWLKGGATRTVPVTVCDGARIGARAIVLPGVSIGSRSVVAAGAIVTRDVPADNLVAGQPARAIRGLRYPP